MGHEETQLQGEKCWFHYQFEIVVLHLHTVPSYIYSACSQPVGLFVYLSIQKRNSYDKGRKIYQNFLQSSKFSFCWYKICDTEWMFFPHMTAVSVTCHIVLLLQNWEYLYTMLFITIDFSNKLFTELVFVLLEFWSRVICVIWVWCMIRAFNYIIITADAGYVRNCLQFKI